ncbi:PAS domain S-box protein [Mariprofundus sp. KV]|uniref:PAS domain S-box protein n=1 Tax=Mariprofundus sp. KV TaxID=2608715 RepID=UPI0015A48E22|nr:PAS domain S-box protein [Mariprofundus sp. KV]NWF37015.1 PAS domain S-box protein [Mariprofundus sp. KV]
MKEIINQLASHDLLQDIVEGVPIRIFWKDRDGVFLGCNTLVAKDAGLDSPDELIGKTDFDFNWSDQAEAYRADDFKVMESGISRLAYEEPQTTPNGATIWLRTSKVPLRDDQQNVIGILGVYEDITAEKLKQSKLIASETTLRNIFNSLQDAYYRTDIEGHIVMVSPSAETMMACATGELQGKSIANFYVNPDERQLFLDVLREGGGIVNNFEAQIRRVDGEVIWVSTNAHYFRDEHGNVTGVEGTIRDVTRLKQQEEELQLAKFVLDHAPLNITYLDSDARIRYINKTGCETLGYTQEELLQMSIPDIDPLFPMQVWHEHWKDLKQNISVPVETEHQRKNGERFPIEVIANYIEFGDKAYNVAFDRDISERKKAETVLQRFRIAIDNSADSIFLIDRDSMRFIDVNEEASRRMGYSRDEFLAMGPSDIKPYVTRTALEETFDRLINQKDESGIIETIHACKDGSEFPVEVRLKTFKEDDRQILVAIARDISDQKLAEDKLEQEARFRSQILEQASEGIALWRASSDEGEAEFLTWNRRMQEITGYSREEINALGWLETMYSDISERERARLTMQKVLQGEINHSTDFNIVTKSGESRTIHISSTSIQRDNSALCVLAVIQDITASRRQQELLEASQKRFSMLFDASSDGLFIIDMQGNFIDINRTAYERLGYSKEEMMAMRLTDLDPPEFAARVPQRLAQIKKHGMAVFETAHYRNDGSIMPVEINARIIELDGEMVFFSVIRDISERKTLEGQLRQALKMEAIGTLVGGIAHDFNNMLAAIQGNLYLATKQMQDHPVAADKLSNIEKLTARATEMVQQLLTFAREGSVEMRVFSLNRFMDDGYKLAKTLIPENIDHQTSTCSEPLHIKGDATQLQQVLMNLLNNAVDALADTGEPMIRCTLEPFKATRLFRLRHPELRASNFACLSIKDNGCGIPGELLDKVFEPFFTTKEVGKGTGLGLAMLYGAVQTHHGAVEIDSKVGKGTTFRIYLPLIKGGIETVAETSDVLSVIEKGRTILLVDDEESVRSTTSEVLSSMGYHVMEAENGEVALQLFKENRGSIDIIISDVIMPRMGGVELFKAVRQLNEKMPLILVTGYDRDHVLDKGIQMQNALVLNKPFDFDELSRSIQANIRTV